MELKAQLSPRVKEENLKSLLTAAQTMFLHLPQTLSTQSLQSIWMDDQGSPSHGGVALVDFVGMYMRGWGQATVWGAP